MKKLKYVYWKDGKYLVGYLLDYPEHWTQGTDLKDLEEHLKDLYHEINEGNLPTSRKVGELVV